MTIEVLAIDSVSAATLRLAGFFASGGGNGVATAEDLKVLELDVPGSAVQVVRGPSGGAALRSRYPSAGAQSYLTIANETEQVPVPATDSSGSATRYIIQRVEDPQFAGAVAEARFECVDSLATLETDGIPHIVLARIDQPLSTATITQGMIVDLRKLASPWQESDSLMLFPAGDKIMSKAGYAPWPFSGAITGVEVPDRATHVDIIANVSGVEIIGSGTNGGGIRTVFDGDTAQNGIILGTAGRQATTIIGTHTISEAQRGETVNIGLEGYQTIGTGSVTADYQSCIAVQLIFKELPS